jgi:hypothetical protein
MASNTADATPEMRLGLLPVLIPAPPPEFLSESSQIYAVPDTLLIAIRQEQLLNGDVMDIYS